MQRERTGRRELLLQCGHLPKSPPGWRGEAGLLLRSSPGVCTSYNSFLQFSPLSWLPVLCPVLPLPHLLSSGFPQSTPHPYPGLCWGRRHLTEPVSALRKYSWTLGCPELSPQEWLGRGTNCLILDVDYCSSGGRESILQIVAAV